MFLSFRGYRERFGNWKGVCRLEVIELYNNDGNNKEIIILAHLWVFFYSPILFAFYNGEVRYNWLVCAKLNYLYINETFTVVCSSRYVDIFDWC